MHDAPDCRLILILQKYEKMLIQYSPLFFPFAVITGNYFEIIRGYYWNFLFLY